MKAHIKILLAIAALGLICGAANAVTVEKLTNGGLETYSGVSPTGWTEYGWSHANKGAYAGAGHAGTVAFGQAMTWSGSTCPGIYQVFTVDSTKAFTVTAWCWSNTDNKHVGNGALRIQQASVGNAGTVQFFDRITGAWKANTKAYNMAAPSFTSGDFNAMGTDNTLQFYNKASWNQQTVTITPIAGVNTYAIFLASTAFWGTNGTGTGSNPNGDNGLTLVGWDDISITQVIPEPSALLSLLFGGLGFAGFALRKRSR